MKKRNLINKNVITSLALGVGLDQIFTSCIAKGSWILTPKGLKKIEDLKEGDLITSINESTGEVDHSPLLKIRSAQREVGQLILGEQSLALTSDHPVYDPLTQEYAPAGDWFLGKRTSLAIWQHAELITSEIKEAQVYQSIDQVFDLTVESHHHNFVANGILVHNKSPPPSYSDEMYCIAEGSWIAIPDGLKRIEDLSVGDHILSINEESGKAESSRISAIRSAQREVGLFKIGHHTLSLTSNHPVYDPLTKEYAPAGDWFLEKRAALSIWKEDRLQSTEVSEVQVDHSMSRVFDLTVESSFHNFVANGILVHNKTLFQPLPMDMGQLMDESIGGTEGGAIDGDLGGIIGGTEGGSIGEITGGTEGGSIGGGMGGITGGTEGGIVGGTIGGAMGGITGGTEGGAMGGVMGGAMGGITGGTEGGSIGGAMGGITGGTEGGSIGGSMGGAMGGITGGNENGAIGGTEGGTEEQ